MQRTGEVDARDIFLPAIVLVFFEPIAEVQNVVCRDSTFAGENVDRVSDRASFSEGCWLACDHFLQVTQPARKHFWRGDESRGFGFTQEIHHICRDETD